jgi:hypothetical protein
MSDRTSLIFALYENGAGAERLAAVAERFAARGLEATVLLTGSRARELGSAHPLIAAAKRSDVGWLAGQTFDARDWIGGRATSADFAKSAEADYDAVLFAAARIPSCYAAAVVPPQAYAALADWNVRAVLTPQPVWENGHGPGFLAGRLHLFTESPHGLTLGGFASAQEVSATFDAVKSVRGPATTLLLPGDALAETSAANVDALLDRLQTAGALVESVRQFTDRAADVPYDHAVPMTAIQALAKMIAESDRLEPSRYDLGWFSPAEQAYLLSAVWVAADEKGKLPRNAQARTPVPSFAPAKPPAPVQSGIDAAKALQTAFQAGDLPEGLPTSAGALPFEALVRALAKHLESAPQSADWTLTERRTDWQRALSASALSSLWLGAAPDELRTLRELYARLMPTWKPAML